MCAHVLYIYIYAHISMPLAYKNIGKHVCMYVYIHIHVWYGMVWYAQTHIQKYAIYIHAHTYDMVWYDMHRHILYVYIYIYVCMYVCMYIWYGMICTDKYAEIC